MSILYGVLARAALAEVGDVSTSLDMTTWGAHGLEMTSGHKKTHLGEVGALRRGGHRGQSPLQT